MSTQLDPIEPAEAVEFYFDHRAPDLSESTLYNQRYRLGSFVEWCEEEAGIENMNELTGRDLHRFRQWRLANDDIKKVTLAGQLQTLKKFLEFAAAIEAVPSGLREQVLMPDVEPEDEARDVLLEESRAKEILEYLEKFEYSSREHIILALLWHTGIRLGSLRAFDVDDFDPTSPCLELRHRPETETPLKNKKAANRSIAIGPHYADILQDYIQVNRPDVRDEHGRRPLLTSKQGRLSQTSIREAVYKMTRPCMLGPCPHEENPTECEAMEYGQASKCPSSRSPHGIRRGSITWRLRSGTPEAVVSDRSNVSPKVLDQHYDGRSEREKMDLRRQFLQDV
jgi:site-specific recombinase XerD